MTKIDKTDLENILLLKKELKAKGISKIKIKKGNYEIEVSGSQSKPNVNFSSCIVFPFKFSKAYLTKCILCNILRHQ